MKTLTNTDRFMIFSNLCLLIPFLIGMMYQEWLYLFFATGLFIFSPLFHWFRISNQESAFYGVFRKADWFFASSAFVYMYLYIYMHVPTEYGVPMYAALSLLIIFFLYGWRWGNYQKWHPWFHIVGPLISSMILILTH